MATTCNSVNTCTQVVKIIDALKYHQSSLKLHASQIVQHFKQVHTTLLDDHLHIMQYHNDQLDDLTDIVTTTPSLNCDPSTCNILKNNFRRSSDQNEVNKEDNKEDEDFIFYRDLLDTIHCYLIHSFNVGVRIRKEELISNNEDNDTFATIKSVINSKRNTKNGLVNGRFLSTSKFSLGINTNTNTNADITFIDGLYNYIISSLHTVFQNILYKIMRDECTCKNLTITFYNMIFFLNLTFTDEHSQKQTPL